MRSRVLIVGWRSNLTRSLASRIEDPTVLGTEDIGRLVAHLDPAEPADIVYNAFMKSSRLRAMDSPADYSKFTFEALSEFTTLCRANQPSIRSVIYTSSSSVYGDNRLASEFDHCEIRGLYPAVKLASEFFVRDFLQDTSIRVVIPRVFNMYGGNDEFSIVAKIADALRDGTELAIANDGEAVRDFIAIEDVVEAYIALLGSRYEGVINIGTGKGMSVRQVIEVAEALFGARLRFKGIGTEEIRVSIASTEQLRRLMPNHRFRSVEDYFSGIIGNEMTGST